MPPKLPSRENPSLFHRQPGHGIDQSVMAGCTVMIGLRPLVHSQSCSVGIPVSQLTQFLRALYQKVLLELAGLLRGRQR